ncbi:hypothetical protein F6X68_31300 [Micromonospora sp. AMSO12t]|uniref:hypothetical protein n=1 Tax=unclassified Micromonospora TaxID=2617518 RepID=UPI00124BB235|nr:MULTISPECIES: hypothetical protein [unclassified Micromonospora]KAB1128516.1 hypothetical protein F6X68_31300 [Micromonospora sp. AMSO12t]WSG03233.1 hypothetical protein OG989_05785 [Micromonospora sp. NBC_01740]
MGKNPRWLLWTQLVAMSCVLLSQVGSGFDRPLEIVVGCGAAGMALYCVAALIIGRTSGNAEKPDAG